MTETATTRPTTATTTAPPARVDWRRVLRFGVLAGVTVWFVSAIGLIESFDRRLIIIPVLSLGYLSLYLIPFTAAFLAGQEQVLEGTEPRPRGVGDVVSGLAVGLVTGLFAAVLVTLLGGIPGVWEGLTGIRAVFPRLSPVLIGILTFDIGVGVGQLIPVAISAGVGALGGAMHLLAPKLRRALATGAGAVIAFSFFELIAQQIFNNIGLGAVHRAIYQQGRGLLLVPAVVIFVLSVGLSLWRGGRESALRRRAEAQTGPGRIKLAVIGLVGVAAFIILPILLGSVINDLLVNVGLFLLMGLGLNIVVGHAGLLDLGYVAFFAVGAYATAVLTSPLSAAFTPELGWWIALPIVVGLAALSGILVGTPVIKMRGDYLAIVTLGFGEIVRILFLSDWFSPVFGGAQGVRQVPGIEVGVTVVSGVDPLGMLYITGIFVAIAAYVSWRLEDSRPGRAWAAMREDETVAEVMGIDTVTSKLLAFVMGAIFAAFGGALFAAKIGSIFPNSFELLVSIIVLVLVIVGGMGHVPGVFVGALVLIGVLGGPTQPGLLAEFQEFKLLIYGALLVYMMLKKPEGLLPSVRRSRELHQDEFLQDAWLDKEGEREQAKAPA